MADNQAPFQKFVAPAPLPRSNTTTTPLPQLSFSDQRRIFKQIIVKCVLQLLLIETTHELLQNDEVYNTIPAEHLLRFMGVLDDSWRFARKFNANRDLRMKLWKVGTFPFFSSGEMKLTGRVHETTTEFVEAGIIIRRYAH
jgi:brefeldin A-inhibited guanine nucleotide-exchange protein